jgi:hypothetical protein
MASSDHLSIDPSGVRGASASVGEGATTAATAPVAITPSAQDVTSVLIANVLGGLVSDLINDTVAANTIAAAAAGRLSDNAGSYEQQEHVNAQALGDAGRGVPAAVTVAAGTPSLVPPTAIPTPATEGTTPTSGRHIAQLIHGGPGPAALETAAALLKTHAGQLDQAAGSIRSARWQNEESWSSDAADTAQTHLVNLEASYTDQAEQARGLAQHASTQAQNFHSAKNQIPTPQHFEDLERRLMAANKANSAPGSMGRFSGVVAKYQTDLAAANTQAVNGFSGYTGGAADVQAMQIHPKVANTTGGAGPRPDGTPPTPGDGKGQNINTASPGTPGGDPAAALLGAPGGAASDMMSTVLPAVLGGVSGLAGGLLGALSGAGQKIQQAGSQLAGGLAQGASSALGSMQKPGSGNDLDTSGKGSGVDPSGDSGDGDGGDPGAGGTEPASSVEGPLSAAPASAAAAPAAAPAMYDATAPAADLAGTGGGAGAPMGGGMMPPMMGGGRGGGGGGQDDRKLYPERKLKIETPPNSEPVRRRVEQRSARTDRGDTKT